MRNAIRLTRTMIGVLILILGFCAKAFSQCMADAKWKRENNRGNRYEGRIEIEISAPPIELVGFYGFRENFARNDILKVRFYLHEVPSEISSVCLIAQEIDQRDFYWMEAEPESLRCIQGWCELAPWPVEDVLGPLEIPADNLGVLVSLTNQFGPDTISPVVLYHSVSPDSINQYRAYFRPGQALVGGTYEIVREDTEESLIQPNSLIGSQEAGIPFLIEFKIPGDWSPGWVRLRIVVRSITGIGPMPSFEYRFFHLPALVE